MSFVVGEQVGGYKITAKVGQGGMATVYRAYHEALDRYVAIKVLHPLYSGDESFLRRFEREARLVARLEHPNIVPIYDFAYHNEHPYLVMRYVEGQTLKERQHRGDFSQSEIRAIVSAIASGLDYAHSQGVLHRDIKPSNILLTPEGGVYITDFGLARMAQAGTSTMSQDMMLGTPQYISPEQARGDVELDGRTDLYSLGIVLYEMVTGRVPFKSDTPYSIIHDHIFTPPPRAAKINATVTPAMEGVLVKALAKNPQDRYATAGALLEEFDQALAGMPPMMGHAPAVAAPPAATPRPGATTNQAMPDQAAATVLSPQTAGSLPPLPTLAADDTPPEGIGPTMLAPLPAPAGTTLAAATTPAGRHRSLLLLGIGIGVVVGIFLVILALLALGRLRQQRQAEPLLNNGPVGQPLNGGPLLPGTLPPNSNALASFVLQPNEFLPPLRQLQRDAAAHPEDLHLQALLALAYLEDGQEAAAQNVVNRVFAGRPDPLLYLQVAQQLMIAEEPALAALVLVTGQQAAPGDQSLLHMLLFAHILADAPAGPIENLADELDRAEWPGQTTYLLAETYLHYLDGDLEEALATLDEARTGGTYQREIEYLEGLVQWDLGQPARATTVLRRAELNDSPPWLTPYVHRLLEEIGET